jgi:toxin ParE1/3/4
VKPYRLTPEARLDLVAIWDYVADRSRIDAANAVLDELVRAMDLLAEAPMIGHIRPEYAPEAYRFWPVFSCLVVYRPTAPLAVVSILHGHRDIRAALRHR